MTIINDRDEWAIQMNTSQSVQQVQNTHARLLNTQTYIKILIASVYPQSPKLEKDFSFTPHAAPNSIRFKNRTINKIHIIILPYKYCDNCEPVFAAIILSKKFSKF